MLDKAENMFKQYLKIFERELPVGESFDMLERRLIIGGRQAVMFFVDGLTDGEKGQRLLSDLMKIAETQVEGVYESERFIETVLPFLDATLITPKGSTSYSGVDTADSETANYRNDESSADAVSAEKIANLDSDGIIASTGNIESIVNSSRIESIALDCYEQTLPKLYAGLVPLIVEGLDKIIIIDCRSYPGRSVDEPEKEKTLRGAKDGFTESMMENVCLIRRRIRDNNLIFKVFNVGKMSKTDVSLVYMKDRADMKMIAKLEKALKSVINTGKDTLSVADQSLLDRLMSALGASSTLNPFPKVRYTQRPDIVAAHLAEGKAAIIVDNSPTIMLIPVSVFEFFQDVDDYYFPLLTGNYFRLIRILNFFVILFLTPVFLLIAEHQDLAPSILKFFVPKEDFAIPIFWQFILLEIAVDGLKLASLNTPTSLGMSLSVIGALILGEFSISSGWFISQTILCMAVVALAAFTQPSIELSFAMKFCRVMMLIGAQLIGIWGVIVAAVIWLLILATTKTLSGKSYLYPLVPFNWKILKRLIFRTQK